MAVGRIGKGGRARMYYLPTPPESSGQNEYFEDLLSRPDFWKAYSLRPEVGDTNPSSPYFEDQLLYVNDGGLCEPNFDEDLEPIAFEYDVTEDAAKLTMPPFVRVNNNTLLSGVDSSTTTIPCTEVTNAYAVNRYIKLDNEICKITARDTVGDTLTVTRAQGGTSAAAHSAGTIVYSLTNTTPTELWMPLNSNGEITRFFFTWDAKFTDSLVGTGLTNFKAWNFRVGEGDGSIFFETNTVFNPSEPSVIGDFNALTDVCATQYRGYSNVVAGGTTDQEPFEPVANPFNVKPNKWTRYAILMEVGALSDPTNYFDVGADLSVALTDTVGTSVQVDMSGVPNFLSDDGIATATWLEHRHYIKIDNEIMRIAEDQGAEGGSGVRTIGVTRGMHGTTAATHSAGATVSLCANTTASVWVSDEDRDPVQVYNGLRFSFHGIETYLVNPENNLITFLYELNTSNDTIVTRTEPPIDLVSYHRNWCALKRSDLDPESEGLLVRPEVSA